MNKYVAYYVRIRAGIFLLLMLISQVSIAGTIVIQPNTVIDKDTIYQNTTLNLEHGSFLIKNNASLSILNTKITGTISPVNPFLVSVANGNLVFKNNMVDVTVNNINATPEKTSLYYVISVLKGNVAIEENKFAVDKSYTIGLFTTSNNLTDGLIINANHINNFHGGILLRKSNNSTITNNRFTNVSSSNIFIIEGDNNQIKSNIILFSGNNNIGDGVDIYYSNHILLRDNFISSGSCYSVVVINSGNIEIDRNTIISGITYAIYITSIANVSGSFKDYMLQLIGPNKLIGNLNTNISITNNYLAQNRFGLAANKVDGLVVKNNFFVQRFTDSKSRKFWTNNDTLFQAVANVIWENNFYKESYSQENSANNQKSAVFVPFPLHGGVTL